MKHAGTIVGLVVLIVLLDLLYRPIYPVVDPVRATLVGVTAYAVLFIVDRAKRGLVVPWQGAFAIFASAMLSVLLIQAGWLVSQSATSAVVHVVILAVAYLAVVYGARRARPGR